MSQPMQRSATLSKDQERIADFLARPPSQRQRSIALVALCRLIYLGACIPTGLPAQTDLSGAAAPPLWHRVFEDFADHLGAFFVAIIAGILAYRELRRQSAAAEIVAKLENERFKSEQTHRERLATFEEQKLASEQVHRERLALIEEQKLTAEQAQR